MVIYCTIYYIVVMAWAIHFLGASVLALWSEDGRLPWATCDNWWNDKGCVAVAANDTGTLQMVDGAVEKHIDSALEYWE